MLVLAAGGGGAQLWFSGTLVPVKKHLQSAGGGAWGKGLRPPLCRSPKSVPADGGGVQMASAHSLVPGRGVCVPAPVWEALTEEGTISLMGHTHPQIPAFTLVTGEALSRKGSHTNAKELGVGSKVQPKASVKVTCPQEVTLPLC